VHLCEAEWDIKRYRVIVYSISSKSFVGGNPFMHFLHAKVVDNPIYNVIS
jgi:hypothetical protein